MDEHATASTSQPSQANQPHQSSNPNNASGSGQAGLQHAYPGASGQNPMAAPGGASPEIPTTPSSSATPDHSDHLGGQGAYSPAPPQGVLRSLPAVTAFIQGMAQAGKPMAVICHAPWELINAGLVRGRMLTSYHTIQADLVNAGANWVDQEVVVDGNLVTSRQPSDIPAFNREMLRLFEGSRQGSAQYGLPTQPGAMPPPNQAPFVPPAEQPSTQTSQP